MVFPFIDLKSLHREAAVATAIQDAVSAVFREAAFIMGESVIQFEQALASFSGAACAIGVDSGTRALELVYRGLGIGAGDEVITTPFTFVATASSIRNTGAKPVFVDIDPLTWNMDPERVAEKVTPRTKAITPVHIFGRMVDMTAIQEAAPGIPVVEDACQAIGAVSEEGAAGSIGLAGAYSFFPTKNLGAAGDGGMVLTSDPELAERIRLLRHHGLGEDGQSYQSGYTARLDAVQAAFLLAKLPFLSGWNEQRKENARRYRKLLDERVLFQDPGVGEAHVYHQFAIRVRERDSLREHLTRKGIPTAVYYPIPVHRHPAFRDIQTGSLPVAETLSREVLALPVCPALTSERQKMVVDAILDFYA